MKNLPSAFQIKINSQTFDYRKGEKLDLNEISKFFEKKNFQFLKIFPQERHVCAIIQPVKKIPRNDETNLRGVISESKYFLKLSTSKGISIVTENEAAWNDAVHQTRTRTPVGWRNRLPTGDINVPKIYERGYYFMPNESRLRREKWHKSDYFYMISSYHDGPTATSEVAEAKIDELIDLSEKIMSLKIPMLLADSYNPGKNHQEKFLNKVLSHFQSIPQEIIYKYNLKGLLKTVENGIPNLKQASRHGDFAPWHLILDTNPYSLSASPFYLIDGEHAMSQGIEYYDICYFIQRIFSVWKNKEIALKIYEKLLNRDYNKNKLKTVFAARAIGGFLDESLSPKPDYGIYEDFKKFVLVL